MVSGTIFMNPDRRHCRRAMSRLASVEAQYAELQANAPDCAAEIETAGLAQAPARPPRPPAFLAGLRAGGIKLKQYRAKLCHNKRVRRPGWPNNAATPSWC